VAAERNPSETLRRVRIVALARGESLGDLARAIGFSHEYLRQSLSGQVKCSIDLVARLKRHLGDDAWMFALGLSNRLDVMPGEVRRHTGA
jgi:plasmid maintenance system antidote protein VapI